MEKIEIVRRALVFIIFALWNLAVYQGKGSKYDDISIGLVIVSVLFGVIATVVLFLTAFA